MAAANPATSVTIPPPTAITTSLRVSPMPANPRASDSTVDSVLWASPAPISNRCDGNPGSTVKGMPAWVTIAARRAVGGSTSPSAATAPWPTTTS